MKPMLWPALLVTAIVAVKGAFVLSHSPPPPVERAGEKLDIDSPTRDLALPAAARIESNPLPGRSKGGLSQESPSPGSGADLHGFDYVKASMPRARAGDARVQYHVGLIAEKCSAVHANYLADGEIIPDEWQDCEGFFHEDPLDGTTGQYWIDRALEAHDPLAVLEQANIRLLTHRGTRAELEDAIALVEHSGDAEALALLTQLRTHNR